MPTQPFRTDVVNIINYRESLYEYVISLIDNAKIVDEVYQIVNYRLAEDQGVFLAKYINILIISKQIKTKDMKILKFNDFVKESVLNVTRSITETIELESITARTWWDGETWYDFDHERKGTYEDFKKLERNKRASFDIHMDFFFEILDEEGKYVDDICKVHTETKLYFTDMEIDDYDIDVKVCNDVDELVKFAKDYNDVTEKDVLGLIKDAWDEYDIDDDLEMDLEDKCGKRDWNRIIEEIKEKIIGRIMNDYNRFN